MSNTGFYLVQMRLEIQEVTVCYNMSHHMMSLQNIRVWIKVNDISPDPLSGKFWYGEIFWIRTQTKQLINSTVQSFLDFIVENQTTET